MAKDERHQTEVASQRRIEAMEMEVMKSDCWPGHTSGRTSRVVGRKSSAGPNSSPQRSCPSPKESSLAQPARPSVACSRSDRNEEETGRRQTGKVGRQRLPWTESPTDRVVETSDKSRHLPPRRRRQRLGIILCSEQDAQVDERCDGPRKSPIVSRTTIYRVIFPWAYGQDRLDEIMVGTQLVKTTIKLGRVAMPNITTRKYCPCIMACCGRRE
ncbi:hypothetical protein V8E54_002197 [Elaphomyces granulatus]